MRFTVAASIMLALLATSCQHSPGTLTTLERDSIIAHLRDSLGRQYSDSTDLAEALWQQRYVVVQEKYSMYDAQTGWYVSAPKAAVRRSPEGRVVDSLRFLTWLPMANASLQNVNSRKLERKAFEEVLLPDSTIGYVQTGDLASYNFGSHVQGDRILVGCGFGQDGHAHTCSFFLYHEHAARPADTLTFTWWGGEGGSYWSAHPVHNLALKGVEMAFLFSGGNAACPEYHQQHLVAVVDGKLMHLMQGHVGGEGGAYSRATMFLPVRFDNRKVLLLQDGDPWTAFNYQEGRLNIWPADSLGIDPANCVVVEEEDAEYLTDENYHHLYDKEGRARKRVSHHKVRVYRWDGRALALMK